MSEPHAAARLHRARKAQPVEAVVDAPRNAREIERFGGKRRQHRQGQEAMRNRAADLAVRAFDIDMDPLMVACRLGEAADLLLADEVPARTGERLACKARQLAIVDYAHHVASKEGLEARLRPPQDESMNVVRAFIGVDRFEVLGVPHHVILDLDAVAAMHVARLAGDIQRLAAIVALDKRDHFRRGLRPRP